MFKRGMRFKVDKKYFITEVLGLEGIIVFDEETTMNYLRERGQNPRDSYVLMCKPENYENYSQFETIDSVRGPARGRIYLTNTKEITPASNIGMQNALERLD